MIRKYLNRCIYTIGMGNNDYISNYFVPNYYETSSEYTPEEYAEVLVEQYSRQLQVCILFPYVWISIKEMKNPIVRSYLSCLATYKIEMDDATILLLLLKYHVFSLYHETLSHSVYKYCFVTYFKENIDVHLTIKRKETN